MSSRLLERSGMICKSSLIILNGKLLIWPSGLLVTANFAFVDSSIAYKLAYVPRIMIQTPMIKMVCAISLSLVFLLLIDMKNTVGNIKQIITPIVDPTIPRTNSIFGTRIPIIKEMLTITIVRHRNLISGK